MCDETLSYYMNLTYETELIPDESRRVRRVQGTTFTAAIPDLRGVDAYVAYCVSFGGTAREAREMLAEAKRPWTGTSRTWIKKALDKGWPVPEPCTRRTRRDLPTIWRLLTEDK